jgi:hypothetical protein
MDILMMTSTDPAGTAILFAQAINRFTQHTCRLITTERIEAFACDYDLHVAYDNLQEVRHLLRHSDVFHFHKTFEEELELGPYRVADYVRGKRVVYHLHGHPRERGRPDWVRARLGRPAAVAVSTPDLLEIYPSASWIPNLVPIRDVPYLPRRCDRTVTSTIHGDVCLIGHSPSRADIKRTEDFVEVVRTLQPHHADMRIEVNQGLTQRDNLVRKRAWNVSVDTLIGGFGMNSLESLCHGIPVVANIREIERAHLADFSGGVRHPWVVAHDVPSLRDALDGLLRDRGRRREVGEYSREYMERVHTPERVLERLFALYEGAPVRLERRLG